VEDTLRASSAFMNSVAITTVIVPGFVSALLFLVFSYLYE
jgi:hypothetical protein